MGFRLTIIREIRPAGNINEEIRWLGNSLGLFSARDKDSSCYRIFIELLKSSKMQKELTSDDIAMNLHLARGTVMHHMNRLLDSGIVTADRNRYHLRVHNLEELMDELEREITRTFLEMKEKAKKIDRELKL